MTLLRSLKFITRHPLNRDHQLAAIARFAKWQIASRLAPGATVYDWIGGARFLVRNGETGLTGNIYTGLQEFQDMAFLLHVSRPEDLFIDVGANVGSYTMLAGAVVGTRGYAFEPVPSTYNRLVDNVRLNRMDDRITCLNIGLSQKPGQINFTSRSDTTNHVLASDEPTDDSICVEVSTLDTVLEQDSILDQDSPPLLIKIDVEGYETPVLEGATKTLSHPALHSVILELNGSGSRYGFDESKTLQMMQDLGFETCSYDPMTRVLTQIEGTNPNSDNTLFVRDRSFVADRLESAPQYEVLGQQV